MTDVDTDDKCVDVDDNDETSFVFWTHSICIGRYSAKDYV